MKLKPVEEYEKLLKSEWKTIRIEILEDDRADINGTATSNIREIVRLAQVEAAEAMREEAAIEVDHRAAHVLATAIRSIPIEP